MFVAQPLRVAPAKPAKFVPGSASRRSALPVPRGRPPTTIKPATLPPLPSSPISNVSICPHPDAVRRRQEADERRRQLNAQARRGWWHSDGVPNMHLITTKHDFRTMLRQTSQRGLVIVNYFAPNCVGCKTLFPKLQQIASRNADVSFLKVNVAEEELFLVAESRGVTKVPFFQILDGDQLVSQFSANLQTVDKLRAEIAACKSVSLQASDSDVYVNNEK